MQKCVVKSKSAQKGMIELNLEIRMKDDSTAFIGDIADMTGVNSAVLVSYNGEDWGLYLAVDCNPTVSSASARHFHKDNSCGSSTLCSCQNSVRSHAPRNIL